MNEPICLIAEGLWRWFRMLDLRMMDVGMQDVPPTFKSMSPFFGFPIPLNIQASHICFFLSLFHSYSVVSSSLHEIHFFQ